MNAPITVVTYTHNRDADRYRNVMVYLHWQTTPATEIITIDSGDIPEISKSISEIAYDFGVQVIRPKMEFSIPHAFNIGIKFATQPYVLTCGADTMYSEGTLEAVMDAVDDDTFVMMERADLPEMDVGASNWEYMLSTAVRRHTICPGALQCASREWFHKVHGYNEEYSGGLGGPDDDMWMRAEQGGMKIRWLEWDVAQALHQWHPISPMKGKLSHLFTLKPEVMKNPDGWGEYEDTG